jgi:hypothetical protein
MTPLPPLMFRGWEPFAALVSRFGRHNEEEEKAMQWFQAQSADDRVSFCRNLETLAAVRADAGGNEVRLFDTLPDNAKDALVAIVTRGWAQFPSQVLLSLQGIEVLRTKELAELVAAERERKRRRMNEDGKEEELRIPWRQGMEEADRAMEEIEDVFDDDDDDDDNMIEDIDEDEEEEEDAIRPPSPPPTPKDDDGIVSSLVDGLVRASSATASQRGFALSAEQIRFLNHLGGSEGALRARFEQVSEEAVAMLFRACGSGIEAAVGSRALTGLIRELLLPRVLQLTRPASRILLGCVQGCIEADGRAAMAGLLVPVLLARVGESSPAELVSQCVEQHLDEAGATALMRAFVAAANEQHLPWTEPMLSVLQRLVARATAGATSDDTHRMLVLLTSQVSLWHANLKFAKLLQTLIRKLGSAASLELARSIAAQLTSFLKKPIETALHRMQ